MDKDKCQMLASMYLEDDHGMRGTAMTGKLAVIFEWLRQQNINWVDITGKALKIISILTSPDDWNTKIQNIIILFNLPAGLAAPVEP